MSRCGLFRTAGELSCLRADTCDLRSKPEVVNEVGTGAGHGRRRSALSYAQMFEDSLLDPAGGEGAR